MSNGQPININIKSFPCWAKVLIIIVLTAIIVWFFQSRNNAKKLKDLTDTEKTKYEQLMGDFKKVTKEKESMVYTLADLQVKIAYYESLKPETIKVEGTGHVTTTTSASGIITTCGVDFSEKFFDFDVNGYTECPNGRYLLKFTQREPIKIKTMVDANIDVSKVGYILPSDSLGNSWYKFKIETVTKGGRGQNTAYKLLGYDFIRNRVIGIYGKSFLFGGLVLPVNDLKETGIMVGVKF